MERGSCTLCHLGNPDSERKNIAHAGLRAARYSRFTRGDTASAREGNRLLDQFACRRCHVSAGRGNRLSVNLDSSAHRKTADELAASIRRPAAHMPDFGLDEDRITLLVNTVLAGSQGRPADKSAPVTVHFNLSATKKPGVFAGKCGSCHRMLSQRNGGEGVGRIGPNLSGLFSEQYPKTFKNGESWTSRNLKTWLKNPREIRAVTRMQPVSLTAEEMIQLETLLQVTSEPVR
jgi:cytochrome c2